MNKGAEKSNKCVVEAIHQFGNAHQCIVYMYVKVCINFFALQQTMNTWYKEHHVYDINNCWQCSGSLASVFSLKVACKKTLKGVLEPNSRTLWLIWIQLY